MSQNESLGITACPGGIRDGVFQSIVVAADWYLEFTGVGPVPVGGLELKLGARNRVISFYKSIETCNTRLTKFS